MYFSEIDLHGMDVSCAKKALDSVISQFPKGGGELTVIHGCNRGSALMKMVRGQYANKRVERKILTLNRGVTVLVIV